MTRARRVLGVIGSVVGATVTFVAATAAAAVIHIDMPATRRLVATQVNGILKSTLMGDVKIEHIGHVGLRGIDGVNVRVKDPDGIQVLHVQNVRVRVNGIDAAKSALFGKGPITITVPSASIGDIDANLDSDAAGTNLRIANAFTPKPTPPEPPSPPGRGVRVDAPDFKVQHAYAHGTPPNALKVDAHLTDLAAHAHITPELIRADLERVQLVTADLPRRVDPKGAVKGYFAMPAPNGQGFDLNATFDGKLGGMPTTAEAHIADQRIDARIDTFDQTGASAQEMVSEVQVTDPLSLHAEAHGDLKKFDANAKVRLGGASVDAKANIDSMDAQKTRIVADASVRHVDLSAIQPDAPASDLGLDAQGTVDLKSDGKLEGKADVDTLPGRLERDAVPRVELRATFTDDTQHVLARIHEASMPTDIEVDVTPRKGIVDGRAIAATVRSQIPDLRRLPKVGAAAGVGGSASVNAQAHLLMPEKAISATADVTLAKTSVPAAKITVGATKVNASVKGTIDKPVIAGDVHAQELVVNDMPITKLDAKAIVEPNGSRITIREARLDALRPNNDPVNVSARAVRIEGPALSVEGAEILGLGDPIKADVSKNPSMIKAKIDAPRIDLATVAKLVDQTKNLTKGTLGIKGEGTLRSNGDASGEVHATIDGLEAQLVHDGKAKIDASIIDRKVTLDANAELADTGHVRVYTTNIVLGGHATDPKSWSRAHGKVHVDTQLDLERVASLVPAGKLPFAEIRGSLTVQGRVGRDSETSPPEVQMHAHTNELVVSGKTQVAQTKVGRVRVEHAPAWRSTNLDFGFDVRNDGTSGLTNVAFHATDRTGAVVAVDVKAILPSDEIVNDPSTAKDKVLSAPIAARIVIPARRLDQLPSVLGVKDLQGAVEAELEATGTVLEPRVHFTAHGRGVRAPSMPQGMKADSDVVVDYDGNAVDLNAKIASEGKDLLLATGRVEARTRDIIEGDGTKPLEWNASAKVKLNELPLDTIPQVADRRVRGRVSGEVALDGLHKDATLKGHIDLKKLAIGRARYEKGTITIDASNGKLAANVRIDQKKDEGYLEASASTGIQWGAEIAPKLDDKQPLEAKLVAKAFQAAAIQPFVESAVPGLEGRIDADARASIVPGRPGALLQGKVAFRDGTVQLAALGDELQAVRATAVLSPDGTIKVTDVFARGSEGEVHAHADAKLDGMRLADANATIEIPKRKGLAVAVQGTPLGEVAGTVKVKASQSVDGKETKVGVDIPDLIVQLPRTTKTGVQQLEEKENIHVGVYRDKKNFVKVALDREDTLPQEKKDEENASKLDVAVHIGRIEIERGNSARIAVTGTTNVAVGGAQTKVTGQITTIQGGWVDVQGKKFEIEKGTITFNGETPPNPVVIVTAGWTAADGSRIYADFVGPVKTGKVTLRSEPPRPKNEILALVLFGTADGVNPGPPPAGKAPDGTTKAAVGLGGGFAAEGLTEALDDLAGIQATARIDTTSSNNPRPEIEFQVSQRISVGFAHVLGNPPITEPDRNLAKGTYRFHRNWSLQTTVGDRGTGVVDAIWQKRY